MIRKRVIKQCCRATLPVIPSKPTLHRTAVRFLLTPRLAKANAHYEISTAAVSGAIGQFDGRFCRGENHAVTPGGPEGADEGQSKGGWSTSHSCASEAFQDDLSPGLAAFDKRMGAFQVLGIDRAVGRRRGGADLVGVDQCRHLVKNLALTRHIVSGEK